jgi:exodeoxyribonuclease-3
MPKILSWNVAGLRSCIRKGFFDWLYSAKPDVLCLQETKVSESDLTDEMKKPKGYHVYWNPAVRKGYAGTAVFTKEAPIKVERGIGIKKFDEEGRFLILHFKKFILVNAYFPHARRDLKRLAFKLEYNDAFLKLAEKLRRESRNHLVIVGDFNVAHKEIDLANPKQNVKNAGFTPQEREWANRFVSKGYVDTFREFVKEGGHYTWWTYRANARKRNIGWRIDYAFVPKGFMPYVKDASILDKVMGSDHCPAGIELKI